MRDKSVGEDAHEAGQQHQVGRQSVDHPHQFEVEGLAAGVLLVVDDSRGDAMARGEGQRPGTGPIADDGHHLGGPALQGALVHDGLQIAATA